jgi:hypothetical protein
MAVCNEAETSASVSFIHCVTRSNPEDHDDSVKCPAFFGGKMASCETSE